MPKKLSELIDDIRKEEKVFCDKLRSLDFKSKWNSDISCSRIRLKLMPGVDKVIDGQSFCPITALYYEYSKEFRCLKGYNDIMIIGSFEASGFTIRKSAERIANAADGKYNDHDFINATDYEALRAALLDAVGLSHVFV